MAAATATDVGCVVKTNWLGAPAVTVTVAVWLTATPPAVADTVLAPAPVELSADVKTRLAFVTPFTGDKVLPVPGAATVIGVPASTLPLASRTVMVTAAVTAPVLAVIEAGDADTVDCVAETAPAVTLKAPLVAAVSPVADAR